MIDAMDFSLGELGINWSLIVRSPLQPWVSFEKWPYR